LLYHDEMPLESSPDPRANQKARTRRALVDAARAILERGGLPSVADAAAAAHVSRATAYRYFPTQEALLLEITQVGPAVEPVERVLATMTAPDSRERLAELGDTFLPIVFREETAMRTALRAYLDTWLACRGRGEPVPPLREGRRMRWLDAALAPARRELTDRQFRRLRAALALAFGVESLVVMRDVCRLDNDGEAQDVLKWAAMSLLNAGLEEARAAKRRRRTAASRRSASTVSAAGRRVRGSR
jgi:AcrR family transcriptional regulator